MPPHPSQSVRPMMPGSRSPSPLLSAAALAAAALGAGCESPLAASSAAELRKSVVEAARRELGDVSEASREALTTTRESAGDLGIRDDHLAEIAAAYDPARYFLGEGGDGADATARQIGALVGTDLLGETTRTMPVGLRDAVAAAVSGNLGVQEARFNPAISEAQVVGAEAVFDWTFFNDFAWADSDTPQPGPGFLGLNQTVNSEQTVSNATGLRRRLTTGGDIRVQQQLVYTDVRESPFGVIGTPNPASQANYTVEVNQPLLRNFGSDAALGEVRVARNAERAAIARLRGTLITTVSEVERAYWDLVLAHRELVISAKLLERGDAVRRDIEARRGLDAVQTQVADAVATVQARRGDILRAQRGLRRASDRLKALLNDPRAPVGSEVLLVPVDTAIDASVEYSLLDSVETAVTRRPEIDIAVLGIDDASVRETVARSGRLPTLDLRASATLRGFGESIADATDSAEENEFFDDFVLGLLFEQPLGNRNGEAAFRRRRLERLQSVVTYRRAVQDVVLDVKNALDNVVTNYKLIDQARSTRVAAAEALRTLQVEKQLTEVGYTVERLRVELSQQDALAAAERAEVRALVDYNASIADLHRAMGTALERNRINFVVPDQNQLAPGEAAVDFRVDPGTAAAPGEGA